MLSAVKTMNPTQKRIPVGEFGEVKFEPAVLVLRTGLKATARHRQIKMTRRGVFAKDWRIQRAGSEGVRLFGPLVQSFRPRPLKDSAKRWAGESERQARK